LALTSGEAASFENNKMQRIVNPSPNTNAWHTHQLQFDTKMPLTEVVSDISEYFGKNVTIENADVMHCRISIPLPIKDPEIAKVLNSVALTINAKVMSDGEKFIIKEAAVQKKENKLS
jgi:ferric-dicitrate binding protein FerR (iron transport regulator)